MPVGIICEYNPFHNGHAYQIAEAKRLSGGAPVVCVMSGNFVQRGDAAILPKHIRAKAALSCGADLVVGLPLPWALSSAEGFARGGVALMASLGVDTISFGSESGDADALCRLARVLSSGEMQLRIKEYVRSGSTYGAARQLAAERLAGTDARLLKNPNDLLGAEYIAASIALGYAVQPLPVPRQGAGHDELSADGDSASATMLRKILSQGGGITPYIPSAASGIYSAAFSDGFGPVTLNELETAILSRLRGLSEAAWDALPGGEEGFGRRLMNCARTASTLNDLCESAKTKRYPMARIRRMLLWAALGLKAGDADGTPPYVSILGANERGRQILKSCTPSVPVITKPAAVRGLGGRAERVFELEAAATDLYTLALPAKARRTGGQEWTTSPVML